MTSTNRLFVVVFIATGMAIEAAAMVSEPIKLMMWRRGETIAGEEFIASNEAVVDYIATLKRPTEPMKGIKYLCQAKGQYIRPSVQFTGTGTSPNQYGSVDIRTVYELKDCVIAP